ncbi:MAG: hypothetical protein O7G85_03205, partial [Planctomycetota bacterium]|nr:hypothetical protein [Planctomycetota bacterium]
MKLAIGKKFRMPLPTTLGVMLVIVTGTAIAEEPIETPTVTDQAQAIVRQTDHRETSVNLKLDFTVDTVNNYMLAAMQDVDTSADIPEVNEPQGDNTGTDPRDFSNKFMPYYLYTKLENDLEVNQLNFFAMLAFTPRFAMTIDIAVAQKIDYSDLDAFKSGSGGIPGGPGFGPPASGGVPFDDLEDDGDVV